MPATYTHVLVLDFDGTVCLGDGPVFAYARLLDEALEGTQLLDAAPGGSVARTGGPAARGATTTGAERGESGIVLATVERFLGATERDAMDGRSTADAADAPEADASAGHPEASPTLSPAEAQAVVADSPPSPAEARTVETGNQLSPAEAQAVVAGSVDGYEAAERLGRALGATDAQLSAAYAGSREELASGAVETYAPDGLAELLLGLPETVQVVLVTNAPENGVTQQLRHLGLSDCFAEVVTSAGKPAGMAPIALRLLRQNELDGHPLRLLNVGDIWRNDLAPAASLGCATALIERHTAPADARPTYRAVDIRQLYPAITAWAATA